jgi:hypothetical protein
MTPSEAEALLQASLRYMDGVWITHISPGQPEGGVEISIRGGQSKPDEAHLTQAAACISCLSDIRPRMEHALNDVSESDPLFPAMGARSWSLEALSFVGDDPAHGVASFTLNESGYDFIYVEYLVELVGGRVVSASARTR